MLFYIIAALTATQCVTYDHAKRFWVRITGWGEGIKLHLGASLITGLVIKVTFLVFFLRIIYSDLLQQQLLHHLI
jgi:hypothetical protein